MNQSFVLQVTSTQLMAFGFLAVLGVATMVGIGIAIKSFVDQRRYSAARLPSITPQGVEAPQKRRRRKEQSAFALDDLNNYREPSAKPLTKPKPGAVAFPQLEENLLQDEQDELDAERDEIRLPSLSFSTLDRDELASPATDAVFDTSEEHYEYHPEGEQKELEDRIESFVPEIEFAPAAPEFKFESNLAPVEDNSRTWEETFRESLEDEAKEREAASVAPPRKLFGRLRSSDFIPEEPIEPEETAPTYSPRRAKSVDPTLDQPNESE